MNAIISRQMLIFSRCGLTHFRFNTHTQARAHARTHTNTHFILKESNFNFRNVSQCDLDIEKWLYYLQKVKTLISRRNLCQNCLLITLLRVSRQSRAKLWNRKVNIGYSDSQFGSRNDVDLFFFFFFFFFFLFIYLFICFFHIQLILICQTLIAQSIDSVNVNKED